MKKLVSLFLSLCICLSVVICMPMSADAEYSAVTSIFLSKSTYADGERQRKISTNSGTEIDFGVDPADSSKNATQLLGESERFGVLGWISSGDYSKCNVIQTSFDVYANEFDKGLSWRVRILNSAGNETRAWVDIAGLKKSEDTQNATFNNVPVASKKWYTVKNVYDKTNGIIKIYFGERDGALTLVKETKLTDTYESAEYFDAFQFMNSSSNYYIANVASYSYEAVQNALSVATTADEVKDIMEFFAENGIITLNSELSDLAANKVYAALAGGTFADAAAVQAKYDELAAKYNVNYIVDFEDTAFTKGAENTFTVNFANNSDEDVNAILINAVYDSDKTLIGIVDSKSVTIAKGEEAALTATGAVSDDAAKVKQIVIDSYNSLTPYAKANELSVADRA